VIDHLQGTLHGLDRRMEELRKQVWMIKMGTVTVDDPEAELNRLEAEFAELGQQFVEAYREWSRLHAEE
jgi:hypothetical protein